MEKLLIEELKKFSEILEICCNDMVEIDFVVEKNKLYKIILIGKRNFEINTREILRVVARENVLKIKDLTQINYDLEELAKQRNLKGIFIKD